jgi:hypothetical protein
MKNSKVIIKYLRKRTIEAKEILKLIKNGRKLYLLRNRRRKVW